MLVTRATRHDRADVAAFLATRGGREPDVSRGSAFIARDGEIVGCVRVIEVAPQTVVVDDVLTHANRRGEGIGRRLMQTAMNSRGGTLFTCCHEDVIPFYEKLGFSLVSLDDAPDPVREYWSENGDIPESTDHVHYYLRAR